MRPYAISLLGLTLDIVGALFLSIEALNLNNFYRWKWSALRAWKHSKIAWPFIVGLIFSLLGLITFFSFGEELIERHILNPNPFTWEFWVFLILINIVLFLLMFGPALAYGVVLMWIIWLGSFLKHNVPTGRIGFIGVGLLLLGFFLQGLGIWLGRPNYTQ